MNSGSYITNCKALFLSLLLVFFCSVQSGKAQQNEIKWYSFEEAITLAQKTGTPILVDVWAPWCGWCQKLKKEVYPKVKAELNNFVLTRLNREDNRSTLYYRGRKLTPLRVAQKLNAEMVPTIIILNSDGDYLLHLSGFTKSESLKTVLAYISSGSYNAQSFEEFLQKSKP